MVFVSLRKINRAFKGDKQNWIQKTFLIKSNISLFLPTNNLIIYSKAHTLRTIPHTLINTFLVFLITSLKS